MKVTTRSSYTVRALLDLAQHSLDGRPVRLSDISEREGISHAYLEQLFNRLKKVEVVRGRKGPGGGYVLGKNARSIFMGEVIRAVEGEEKLFLCTEDTPEGEGCPRYPECITHLLWERLSQRFHQYLNSISLADLLKEAESLEKGGDKA
ncbi:MAG: Rrf2 family transcriptional regulator [bacterium]|nr:MAG: Rrf2 family transcriptional regulator [bacterium]